MKKSVSTRSFPLTAKYDAQWILDNALGENALCQAECLARHLSFKPGVKFDRHGFVSLFCLVARKR